MGSLAQSEGRLLFCSQGKNTFGILPDIQRAGRIAAASAQKVRHTVPLGHKGIVTAVLNSAVVEKKSVRSFFQGAEGFFIFCQNRAAGNISACHD